MVELTSQCPASREMKAEGSCGGEDQENQRRDHFSTGPPISTGRGWDSSWAWRERLRVREARSGLPCAAQGCRAGGGVGPAKAMNGDALQSTLRSLRMRAAQEEGAA